VKYFGEFLVSKNIINEKQLVEILIDQIGRLPSVPEIILKNKILDPNKIIQIFNEQSIKKIDFRQAAMNLNFWNQDIENKIDQEINTQKTPLGKLLIMNGVIDSTTLTKALDEFLSRVEAQDIISFESSSNPHVNVDEQLKLDSHEKINFDSVLLKEFINFISEDKVSDWLEQFEKIKNENDLVACSSILRSLLVEIHGLKGHVRILNLSLAEQIIHKLEQKILGAIKASENNQISQVKDLANKAPISLSFLNPLRVAIEKDEDLNEFFSRPVWVDLLNI
jgi:hypothetical protein